MERKISIFFAFLVGLVFMNIPIMRFYLGGISISVFLFYIGFIVMVLFGSAIIYEGIKELNFTFVKKLFRDRITRKNKSSL